MNLREAFETKLEAASRPASLTSTGDAVLALLADGVRGERLAVAAPAGDRRLAQFSGERQDFGDGHVLLLGPCDHANARALREVLPNLQPLPLGLATSAGCGDRLGLATPGHVAAFQAVGRQPGARPIQAIFAQQSIREMVRTKRSPEEVLTDATWGAFAAGWRGAVGADADHLKTLADIDATAAVGFSFYTLDPGEHVDSSADQADGEALAAKVAALPWDVLEASPADLDARYGDQTFDLGEQPLGISREQAWRAAAKYGGAVAHVARLYRHLAGKGIPFELEVSVDETATPTTHAEHYYVASELRRLGVRWVSLAPRFVGRFEKGVDYLGDLEALRADLAGHAHVARALGPYKLSLHSGSDKFSVYPLIAEATRGLVHLKTAGTSYLEALRVLAQRETRTFREIAGFACARYTTDRASYHVSANVEDWPDLASLGDHELPALLDDRAARQMLHVTFGSVLAEFGPRLKRFLMGNQAAYALVLEQHFVKHLQPFA